MQPITPGVRVKPRTRANTQHVLSCNILTKRYNALCLLFFKLERKPMSNITQNRNESVERMISRFRRVVLRSGHLKQIRRSRYFKKDASQGMAREKAQFREFRREQRRKQSK